MSDRRAFLELFLRQQQDLHAFVGSIVRDWHRSEDVVQELALILWEKFESYDPQRPFGAWARGVAANLILRDLERHRRALPLLSPESIAAVQRAYDEIEASEPGAELEALRACVASLDEPARHMLELRYTEALGLDALAQRLSRSVAAVKKALTRLRARLQECVARKLAASGEAPGA
ncbi:MAG: sigma-70 family RNA polymerase sigma factor [Planctomycetes bacterium]|nr:sigma-70 family RNA polymerase sigma factor [Planctomycetota bacterium]